MRPITSVLLAGALALTLTVQPTQAQLEFGIPTPLPAYINGGLAGVPFITPDNLSMYFTANLPGSVDGSLDIWKTSRASAADPWETPVSLGATFNTAAQEWGVSLTADGLELYFERSSILLSHDDSDLWVSKRASVSDPWGAPEPLAYLNTPIREAFPYVSPDGLELYYDSTSEPNTPIPGNLVNIYVARRTSRAEAFGAPEWFEISAAPQFTHDGLTFSWTGNDVVSKYYGLEMPPGGLAQDDLWYRTRANISDPLGPPMLMQPPVSGSGLDCCGAFSADGATFYFTSLRPGAPGFINIWQATLADAISLDINPGGGSDPINWLAETVLPAAILATDTLDALNIDVSSLLFGDPLSIADGATPVSPVSHGLADVNGDGRQDLTLEFSIAAMRDNGVVGLLTAQGYVAGTMLDGTVIAGRDALSIVPEPSSALLLFAGLAAFTLYMRK